MAKESLEDNPSIIRIIQEMVRKGESEKDIMSTLRGLGIDEERAKRLLMLGQADTFALVESEVSKIVRGSIAEEEEDFKIALKRQLKDAVGEAKIEMEKNVRDYTDKKTGKILEMMEEGRQKNEEALERSKTVEMEMKEVRMGSGAGQGKVITLVLILMGIGFLLFDAYLFYKSAQTILTVDQIVLNLVIAVAGIAMLFTASVV